MKESEAERRARVFQQFEDMSEDTVRAEIQRGRVYQISPEDEPLAREWLIARDRARNERVLQENAAAVRRSVFWAAFSAVAAGIAAVAALATAILTYTYH